MSEAMRPAQVEAAPTLSADDSLPVATHTSDDQARVTARLAGGAWMIAAALTGYLSLLQFGYVGTIFDDGSLMQTAVFNGGSAIITLYFGARLLTGTSNLVGSMIWSALSVVGGVYQAAQGVTHEAFLGAIVAAGAAGILTFSTYQQLAGRDS